MRYQCAKKPATKPVNLNLFLGTHMVAGEIDSCKMSSDVHTRTMACMLQPHTYKINE